MSTTNLRHCVQRKSHSIKPLEQDERMITVGLREMLARLDEKAPLNKPRTLYWLQKETGISASTIWRLSRRQPKAIEFDVLERLCRALQCKPGDLLVMRDTPQPLQERRSKGRKVR